MQFKVPQFLDIEDKIFGPFTFRQFIYLVGGAGLCFILYRLIGFWFGFIPIFLIGAFSAALAFYRPNNKPFIFMVEAVFKYLFQDKLYIWRKPKGKMLFNKEGKSKAETENQAVAYQNMNKGRLNGNK